MAQNQPHQVEIPLGLERETRSGLAYFRPSENITLTTEQRFVVLPGDKGHDWVIRVVDSPPG